MDELLAIIKSKIETKTAGKLTNSVRHQIEQIHIENFESVPEKMWALHNNIFVRPVCLVCGKRVNFNSVYKGFYLYCGTSCVNKCPIIRNKIENTCLLKFGKINAFQQLHVVQKAQASLQTLDVKNKIAASNKKTCNDRYGVDNVMQIPEVKQKQKQTCISLYGQTGWCSGTNELHKQRIMELYGVDNVSKIHFAHIVPYLEDKEYLQYMYEQLQMDLEEIRNEFDIISVAPIVKALKKFNIRIRLKNSSYSNSSIKWLEYLMQTSDIKIQHAKNGGEFKIKGTRYRVDGYCKENNTVYEFYGDVFHGNINVISPEEQCHPFNNKTAQQLYDETLKREQIIRDKGYNLISMWEYDWRILQNTNKDFIL